MKIGFNSFLLIFFMILLYLDCLINLLFFFLSFVSPSLSISCVCVPKFSWVTFDCWNFNLFLNLSVSLSPNFFLLLSSSLSIILCSSWMRSPKKFHFATLTFWLKDNSSFLTSLMKILRLQISVVFKLFSHCFFPFLISFCVELLLTLSEGGIFYFEIS